MSILVSVTTPGMDAGSYDTVFASLGDGLPDGCTAHHAGPTDAGWRVLSVWDSRDQAGAYAMSVLRPAVERLGLRPGTPEVTELHRSLV